MEITATPISSTIFSIMYSPLDTFRNEMLLPLLFGVFLAFVLGFAMGANDVANAFGTSVGSGVLTLKKAYLLAVIFEALGAVLVGYNVTDTMRKGVIDVQMYNDTPEELFVGEVAILGGCSVWLLIATFCHLPVSTTHSITGATVGFGLLMRGTEGIHWRKIFDIAASWFISPMLSGFVSCILYMVVDITVIRRKDAFDAALEMLPFFYFFCIAFNFFTVTYQGSKLLHLSSLPLWFCLSLSIGVASISSVMIYYCGVPRLRDWIMRKVVHRRYSSEPNISVISKKFTVLNPKEKSLVKEIYRKRASSYPNEAAIREQALKIKGSHLNDSPIKRFFMRCLPNRTIKIGERTSLVFGSIQAFTACFAGFAHGANDVANAIGPLSALLSIYTVMDVNQRGETPLYVVLYGVLAVCLGLLALGHKVIRTVGTNMSEINPASGFAIEFGAAVTAILASKAGLPISTTHSLVGSVVCVGFLRSRRAGVNWKLFRNVALSWVLTLPLSGFATAGLMIFLRRFVL